MIDLLNKESQLVDAMRSSIYTKMLADLDLRIDYTIVGINSIINAGLHHFDPIMVEAATILYNRMKAFGSIEKKAYEEESGAVTLLLYDLMNKYAQQVDTLSMRDWVNELETVENEFKTIFKERNAEYAAKPDYNLKDIRKEIDGVYYQIVQFINANAIVAPSLDYESFLSQLNAEIEYAIEHSHQHAKKDLSTGDRTVIEPIDTQTYSGEPIIVIPKVYYREEGKPTVELVFSKDFNVTYKNNVNVGTADLIIHGKGKYRGQKITTFAIERSK
jgi:hypothetical protein